MPRTCPPGLESPAPLLYVQFLNKVPRGARFGRTGGPEGQQEPTATAEREREGGSLPLAPRGPSSRAAGRVRNERFRAMAKVSGG